MEKSQILGLGQKIYKVSLEYPVVPESNKVLKKRKKSTLTGVFQRDTRIN